MESKLSVHNNTKDFTDQENPIIRHFFAPAACTKLSADRWLSTRIAIPILQILIGAVFELPITEPLRFRRSTRGKTIEVMGNGFSGPTSL